MTQSPAPRPLVGAARCSTEVLQHALRHGVDLADVSTASGPSGEITAYDVDLVAVTASQLVVADESIATVEATS